MFKSLLYLGILAVSFAIFPNTDIRELKMALAVIFAISLSMVEIFYSGIKPNKNIWVLIFLAYLPISIILAPCPQIDLQGIPVNNFWSWFPFLKMFIFSIFFFVISGHEFDESTLKTILKIFVWCGFLVSLYELTQIFYTDQFFIRAADGDWGRVAGILGNPTLTSPFCAMMIPFALYFKDYLKATVMVVGTIVPYSAMGVIAMIVGLIVYCSFQSKKKFIIGSVLSLLIIFSFCFYLNNKHLRERFDDHERFYHWKVIWKDWTGALDKSKGVNNIYSLTGRGIGSFRFVYHIQHPFGNTNDERTPNRFHQAHNDYLELGYSLGFVGIGLFLMGIYHLIKQKFSFQMSHYHRTLISSLSVMMVAASGVFLFQIGTFSFLGVLIAGLLHNERCLNG